MNFCSNCPSSDDGYYSSEDKRDLRPPSLFKANSADLPSRKIDLSGPALPDIKANSLKNTSSFKSLSNVLIMSNSTPITPSYIINVASASTKKAVYLIIFLLVSMTTYSQTTIVSNGCGQNRAIKH